MEGMKADLPGFHADEAVCGERGVTAAKLLCAAGSDGSARHTRLQPRGQRTRDRAEAAVIARSLSALLERLWRCLGSGLAAAV